MVNKLQEPLELPLEIIDYLEGVMDGDSLKLSTFDGAHAFLFIAKVTDSTFEWSVLFWKPLERTFCSKT